MTILIQKITPADTWQIRHEVMWPNQSIDFVKLPEDAQGIHYGLFLDQVLTSVVSLFTTGHSAQFRKFATLISQQGKGYGTMLLNHVLTEAATDQINSVFCNARVEKVKYYEKFGLNKTNQICQKKGINYVIMTKTLHSDEG